MKWQHSTDSPTYDVWCCMHYRCNTPTYEDYKNYGGRGIKVCKRWDSYDLFIEDMGFKPDGLTLERLDNDGDYEPTNCKWATRAEQSRNKRNNTILTLNGRSMCLADWSIELDIPKVTIMKRMRCGFPVEQVLYKGNLKHYPTPV